MCKLDLKDAYFCVPLSQESQKLVRFYWSGNLYEFLCLCFGLGPAPRIFTKLIKIPTHIVTKANKDSINCISRRFLDFGQDKRGVSRESRHSDSCFAMSRICNKREEIGIDTLTENTVFRNVGRFFKNGVDPS